MVALGANLVALGANLDALGANLDALGANLGALVLNLSAQVPSKWLPSALQAPSKRSPGASKRNLDAAWPFQLASKTGLMCCAKRCIAVLSSNAALVFYAMGCGIRATKQLVNR